MKVAALNALQQMDVPGHAHPGAGCSRSRDTASACIRFWPSRGNRGHPVGVGSADPHGSAPPYSGSLRSAPSGRWSFGLDSPVFQRRGDPGSRQRSLCQARQSARPTGARPYAERNKFRSIPNEPSSAGQRQTPENAAFLRSLYGRLTGEELKKKVRFAISAGWAWLLGIARDTSERVGDAKAGTLLGRPGRGLY